MGNNRRLMSRSLSTGPKTPERAGRNSRFQEPWSCGARITRREIDDQVLCTGREAPDVIYAERAFQKRNGATCVIPDRDLPHAPGALGTRIGSTLCGRLPTPS